MTTPRPDLIPEAVRADLRAEILRWNPVVNLVSRQDPRQEFDRHLAQCEAGLGLVLPILAELRVNLATCGYVDIGSGNGLPGLPWLAGLRAAGLGGPAWLVEPRQRRAWVLARLARRPAFAGLAVVVARWGRPLPPPTPDGDILISIKALKLAENDVLDGLDGALPDLAGTTESPRRVVVARFLGPDPGRDQDLVRSLRIGEASGRSGMAWRPILTTIVAAPSARLLITASQRP